MTIALLDIVTIFQPVSSWKWKSLEMRTSSADLPNDVNQLCSWNHVVFCWNHVFFCFPAFLNWERVQVCVKIFDAPSFPLPQRHESDMSKFAGRLLWHFLTNWAMNGGSDFSRDIVLDGSHFLFSVLWDTRTTAARARARTAAGRPTIWRAKMIRTVPVG